SNPGRPPIWQALVGVVISIVLLWWSLRGVSLADVAGHVRTARPWPMVVGVLLATFCFPLRLARWRLLLRREDGTALPNGPLWHGIAIGFMANNVLPLRAGEVIRTYAVSRLGKIRFTAALSSIAVERVFDGLTLVALLALALFLPGLPAHAAIHGTSLAHLAIWFGLLFLIVLVAFGMVLAWPSAAEAVVRRVVPRPKLAEPLVGLIEGVRHGLVVLRSPTALATVGFWSVAVWVANAAAFYAFFSAFDIPVNFAGAMVMQSILAFGISVPAAPGYVGVFEASIVLSLALYGIARDQAVSYALVYHFTTFVPITLLGLWSVARTHLGLRELRGAA
ncbi:MAG: lysylphosphatidylglycerol synthase transmembrane domain-containing protein, partial [Gemmatimonadales bacterium]